MIDTIRILLYTNQEINYDNLTLIEEKVNQSSGEMILTGKLKNLNITKKADRLYISGSLTKYYYGNNLANLSRSEIEIALLMIEESLRVSIRQAIIYRLDLALNLQLSESPKNYLNCLGSLNRFERDTFGKSGLYYRQKEKCLVLYDKSSELKRKKVELPIDSSNFLRIELRFLKRINKAFGKRQILISDLLRDDFYLKSLNHLDTLFKKIERRKMKKIADDVLSNLEPKNLINYLAAEYLREIGLEKAIEYIEQLQRNQAIDRLKAYRLKAKIKQLNTLPKFTESSPLVIELDTAFNQELDNLRAS